MSRRRLLGLSGLSTEVTATLLLIEERQAKLANILKEIQGEIDYMETLSAPDLRKLIDQAEKYLKQNESDLERAGSKSNRRAMD
jgi:molecular chaperone DnaK (HSP70)